MAAPTNNTVEQTTIPISVFNNNLIRLPTYMDDLFKKVGTVFSKDPNTYPCIYCGHELVFTHGKGNIVNIECHAIGEDVTQKSTHRVLSHIGLPIGYGCTLKETVTISNKVDLSGFDGQGCLDKAKDLAWWSLYYTTKEHQFQKHRAVSMALLPFFIEHFLVVVAIYPWVIPEAGQDSFKWAIELARALGIEGDSTTEKGRIIVEHVERDIKALNGEFSFPWDAIELDANAISCEPATYRPVQWDDEWELANKTHDENGCLIPYSIDLPPGW